MRYDLNLPDIAEVWRRGSVVGSWLLDLTAMALVENPSLSEYTGFVPDSGEGRWTVQAALEEAVPSEVLTAALYTRFRSRQEHTFAEKMLERLRSRAKWLGSIASPDLRQTECHPGHITARGGAGGRPGELFDNLGCNCADEENSATCQNPIPHIF